MVGPFMQGVLLMGIIYWYTKGMLSLINDYYRSEIQRKILVDEPLNESSDFIGVDQIVDERLGKIKNKSGMVKQQELRKIVPLTTINIKIKDPGGGGVKQWGDSKMEGAETNVFVRVDVCIREKRLKEFYKLLEQTINHICIV